MDKVIKGFAGKIRRFAIAAIAMLIAFLSLKAAPGKDGQALQLHPDNPHYLLFQGKPAVLIGSTEHYGAVLNLDFDYVAYLDAVQAAGLNLTRTFSGVYVETPGAFKIDKNTLGPVAERFICPWARSNEPGYRGTGGGNKFDLTKWDEAYFKRLKDFVTQAGKRGIVVEYVLFCPYYEDSMWDAAPINVKNNNCGVGKITRTQALTLNNGPLLDVQDAMVRKIVKELKDFDNLYYEICNEPYFGGVTIEWQHHIADTIVATEKDNSAKHLIAQNIANGKAKIEKPHPAVSIFNFHYATPPDTVGMNYGLNKPIADDETGFKGTGDAHYRKEGWQFLLAGGAIYDHLDYSFTVGHEKGDFAFPAKQPGGGGTALRSQFRIMKDFVCGFDFTRMKPDRAAVGGLPNGVTAYTLSEPGKAYAIYLNGGTQADFGVELPAGTYKTEWINTKTGKTDKAESFTHGGGRKALNSPAYTEDIALKIVSGR